MYLSESGFISRIPLSLVNNLRSLHSKIYTQLSPTIVLGKGIFRSDIFSDISLMKTNHRQWISMSALCRRPSRNPKSQRQIRHWIHHHALKVSKNAQFIRGHFTLTSFYLIHCRIIGFLQYILPGIFLYFLWCGRGQILICCARTGTVALLKLLTISCTAHMVLRNLMQ